MRTMFRSLVLALGLALAAPTVSEAASPAAKEQKLVVKDAKKDLKNLDKIIKGYSKAVDKGKDTAKVDEMASEMLKLELRELRRMGVQINVPDEKPRHPRDTRPPPPKEESDNPWLEKFRDQLLAVREAKNPKPRLKQLQELRPMFATRLERAERRYEKLK